MPNWARTTMRVEGKPEIVKSFHSEFFRVPVGLKTSPPWDPKNPPAADADWIDYQAESPECRMWNVIAPPEEIRHEYFQTISINSNNRDQSNNWYEWNIKHWGTKWDLKDVDINTSDVGPEFATYVYSYDTAWGPPIEFMIRSSELFDVLFTFDGYEEGGIEYSGAIQSGQMTDYTEKPW